MLKTLRKYRTVALLTAFALVASAFAPLSAVCGMDFSESMSAPNEPMALPCYQMGGVTLDTSTPIEHESAGDPDVSANAMFTLSCCVAQGPTAPKTERAAQLAAKVAEVVSEIVASPSHEAHRQITTDDLPPPLAVARHLLFGCFLT